MTGPLGNVFPRSTDTLFLTQFTGLACRETNGARQSETDQPCRDRTRPSSAAAPLIWSSQGGRATYLRELQKKQARLYTARLATRAIGSGRFYCRNSATSSHRGA